MEKFVLCVAILFGSVSLNEAAWPCDTTAEYFEVQNNCSSTHLLSNNGGTVDGNVLILCSQTVPAFVNCMTQKFTSCDATLKQTIDSWAVSYKARMCDGNQLKTGLNAVRPSIVNVFDVSLGKSCLPLKSNGQADADSIINNCASTFISDELWQGAIAQQPIIESMKKLEKYGKSIIKCTRQQLRFTTSCSEEERRAVMWHFVVIAVPMGIDLDEVKDGSSKASPRELKRVTVAAYGDPHLKVYKQNLIVTCSASGRTKYLENDYISIYVTNTPAVAGSVATVMSKVEITLRNSSGSSIAEYVAENSQLVNAFVNGKSSVKVEDGGMVMIEQLKDRFVRLSHSKGGGAIVISRYKNIFSAVVGRFSDSLLADSTGLMVDGCLDEIQRPTTAGRRKRSVDCTAACGSQGTYQSTCQYDCDITGDTEMATTAGNDMITAEDEAEALDAELSGAASVSAMLGLVVFTLICGRL